MRALVTGFSLLLSSAALPRFSSKMAAAMHSARVLSQASSVPSTSYASDCQRPWGSNNAALSSQFISDELSNALRESSLTSNPTPTRVPRYSPQFRAQLSSPSASSSSPSPSTPFLSFLSPLDRIRNQQVLEPEPDYLLPNQYSTLAISPEPELEPEHVNSAFAALGLSSELLAAINELGLKDPTEIQALGIPAALNGESLVMASHTGSGKTLAYLLPIVQMLRRDEEASGRSTRPKKPRALVLCPTRELAEQVLKVAKSLCHFSRFRSTMISGGGRMRPQQEALNSCVDIVVGTPGRLAEHFKEGNLSYSDVHYVVLDEADTMFDKGFGPDVRKLLLPLRTRGTQAGYQTLLVTATITKSVQRLLDEEFPGIRPLFTSSLHKRVSTARHGFLTVAGTENKLDTLLQVVHQSATRSERVLVFCNTVQSCRAADHFLSDSGLPTLNYHGEVPAQQRLINLNLFREGKMGGEWRGKEEGEEEEEEEWEGEEEEGGGGGGKGWGGGIGYAHFGLYGSCGSWS